MKRKIEVLNKGFIELVDWMGGDLSVVQNARQSFNQGWRTGQDSDKDAKLIHYLMKNRHSTPFESVTFTFQVKAPIFVFRQWHRHRTQSYNEMSARYTELPEEFYIPTPQTIGVQSNTNKQCRDMPKVPQWMEEGIIQNEIDMYVRAAQSAFATYRDLLYSRGWPRELARMVLPVSTYSVMSCTMNLHNLFHFLGLRLDPHAQYEIRVYAEAMLELIQPVVPICVEAFKESRESWQKAYKLITEGEV